MPSSSTPWLTVITVVKDATVEFVDTARSLAAQDLSGVEYLVIDSSLDRLAIPSALSGFPALANADVQWIEPHGIYAAMNEGLDRAHGEYVYFANAGDTFYSPDTLARVRARLKGAHGGGTVWAFGPVEILSQDATRVITPPWEYAAEQRTCFSNGHFPCHQGTFAAASALRSFDGFDTEYSIVADYAAFLRLSRMSDPVELDFVIATFAEGGVSTRRWRESFRQFHAARRQVLRPTGVAALRERWNSARQFARVWIVRSLLRRGRP